MKKLLVSILLFSQISLGALAQENVKTIEGKKYSEYTVKKGDTWFSIAKSFKITLAELRLANKKDDKLITGKKILIPADKLKSNDPFYGKNHMDSVEKKGVPKTHNVASGETLFSIAKKYNVLVDDLKKANHLTSGGIKKGQVLVIPSEGATNKENSQKGENKVNTIDRSPEQAPKPEIKEDKSDSQNTATGTHDATHDQNKQVDKSQKEAETIFATGRQQVTETGVAEWIDDQDINPGKYYALHRNAPIGTIIRITNRMNERSIFVKVIGKLPDTGDNDGLIIKISKASAEKLGVIDQRFQAQLLYGLSGGTMNK